MLKYFIFTVLASLAVVSAKDLKSMRSENETDSNDKELMLNYPMWCPANFTQNLTSCQCFNAN